MPERLPEREAFWRLRVGHFRRSGAAFDSGPSTLTPAQALMAGHIREALAIDRKLIDANAKDAVGHLHLARALLDGHEFDDRAYVGPTDTYVLARQRIAALKQSGRGPSLRSGRRTLRVGAAIPTRRR